MLFILSVGCARLVELELYPQGSEETLVSAARGRIVGGRVDFVRWTISTGQPALAGFNKVPPRLGPTGWVYVP